VPAGPVVPLAGGVHWQAYEGKFPWVPDFSLLPAVASGTVDFPQPDLLMRREETGLYFTGYLQIPSNGNYAFQVETDGGAVLRIHDATVIDADFDQPNHQARSGNVRLQAGLHPFRLYYSRGSEYGGLLKFYWSGPGIVKELIPASVFGHEQPGSPEN
jgi:hypothetical protein